MSDKGFTDVSQRGIGSMDKLMQPPKSISEVNIVRLIHRVAVFIVAVMYVHISLQSFSTALVVLRGQVSHDLPIEVYTSNLITGYTGSTTIAKSPLVQQVLDGSTSPRNNSLYLETSSAQSYTGCSDIPNFDKGIYSNEFMRFIFSRLQEHASYNLSYVTDLELVLPVVDCTFELLVSGDRTVARIYYLVRRKSDPTQVLLLSTSLSAQDYQVDQQFQKGPGLVLLMVAIDDILATTLNHHIAVALNYPYVADPVFAYSELEGIDDENYWILQTLPNQHNQDPAKVVRMARRFGRYKSDVTAQSNIENTHWDMTTNPTMELGEWKWNGRAVLHDSWAWTHAIHGIFALKRHVQFERVVLRDLSTLPNVSHLGRRCILHNFKHATISWCSRAGLQPPQWILDDHKNVYFNRRLDYGAACNLLQTRARTCRPAICVPQCCECFKLSHPRTYRPVGGISNV